MKRPVLWATFEFAVAIFWVCVGYFAVMWLVLHSEDHIRMFAIERFVVPVLYGLGYQAGRRLDRSLGDQVPVMANRSWLNWLYWVCFHVGFNVWIAFEIYQIRHGR